MHKTLADIRLVATDIDGTLTDGGMYCLSNGETFKRFNVRDGLGVKLLRAANIDVAFISSDSSSVIKERARSLGIQHCFTSVENKVDVVDDLCQKLQISWSQVVFLGDDLQDSAVMSRVGLPVAVADAHSLIRRRAKYVCKNKGGYGAFREFAEWILSCRGYDLERLLSPDYE